MQSSRILNEDILHLTNVKCAPLTILVSELLLVLVISICAVSSTLRGYCTHLIKRQLIVDWLQWFARRDLTPRCKVRARGPTGFSYLSPSSPSRLTVLV